MEHFDDIELLRPLGAFRWSSENVQLELPSTTSSHGESRHDHPGATAAPHPSNGPGGRPGPNEAYKDYRDTTVGEIRAGIELAPEMAGGAAGVAGGLSPRTGSTTLPPTKSSPVRTTSSRSGLHHEQHPHDPKNTSSQEQAFHEQRSAATLQQLLPSIAAPSTLAARCPVSFREPGSLPSQSRENAFPHDPGYIVPLYVAVKDFGLDLAEIDFVLGGSCLGVLATRGASLEQENRYLVEDVGLVRRGRTSSTSSQGRKNVLHEGSVQERSPGSSSDPRSGPIFVNKSKKFTQNYNVHGFQFERFVTGGRFEDPHDYTMVPIVSSRTRLSSRTRSA